jgi:hypothetical protein
LPAFVFLPAGGIESGADVPKIGWIEAHHIGLTKSCNAFYAPFTESGTAAGGCSGGRGAVD